MEVPLQGITDALGNLTVYGDSYDTQARSPRYDGYRVIKVTWIDGTFDNGVAATLSIVDTASGVDTTICTLSAANDDKSYWPREFEPTTFAIHAQAVYGKLKLVVTAGGDTKAGGCMVVLERLSVGEYKRWRDYSTELLPYLNSLPDDKVIWGIDELSGSTLIAYPNPAMNGSQVGFTLGVDSGGPMKLGATTDGSTDYAALYSTALNSIFNPNLGTLLLGFKLGAGDWATATLRTGVQIGTDVNNRVALYKSAVGTFRWWFNFGGVSNTAAKTGIADYGLVLAMMTINKASGGVRGYWQGVQQGTPAAITGTWAGALTNDWCGLGSGRGTSAVTSWLGDLYIVAYSNQPWDAYALSIAQHAGVA